ncbi:MAG: hypothetical protein LRY27_01365 [Chitinophagales bacterium]|nr:hypothetical protein [Chitinophagales bacterium]
MISFFKAEDQRFFAVQTDQILQKDTIEKLTWLFGNAQLLQENELEAPSKQAFIGPRAAMVSP